MPEDYVNWNLTNAETDFIFGKTYRDFPYAILLSRPATGESVILDVDLSGLGPYLRLYNSGRKNVLLVEELIKEYGEEKLCYKIFKYCVIWLKSVYLMAKICYDKIRWY